MSRAAPAKGAKVRPQPVWKDEERTKDEIDAIWQDWTEMEERCWGILQEWRNRIDDGNVDNKDSKRVLHHGAETA